jgi:diguanylate cyclase (GGDEF)-like protein
MRPLLTELDPPVPARRGRAAIQVRALPYRNRGMFLAQPGLLERLAAVLTRSWRAVRERMQEDFRLAVILLCSTLSVLVITPFALFRFGQGEFDAGLVDLALVTTIAWANAHAWRTGQSDGPGLVMVLVNTVGCLAVTALLGLTGSFWAYAVVLMNFFLAGRLMAMVASAALIAGIAMQLQPLLTTVQLVSFIATTCLVCLYAYVFALRAARQAGRLQDLALRDPLTGIGNRRLMELDLDEAAQRFSRSSPTQPALAVLDLDHFKQVNDRHGHEAGDQVIIDFVALVRQSLRRGDRLYRLGGEEFVVLLGDVDNAGVWVALTKVHTQVRARLRSPAGPVTVSIGAAVLAEGESWPAWLARADQALYAAKHNGRNRSVLAPGHEANDGDLAAA